MPLLFAATLLLSAALMFVAEPMFAKMVLPRLGGSPSVWNTCLVFYQAALLAGYVYAHLSLRWLGARRQSILHLVLLGLPWFVLPIGLAAGWTPPGDSNPIPWLWMLLTVSVGLPFFVVSATAPMLQAWFSQTGHPSAKDPYFLYAASNLGSMAALLGYPLVIECQWTLAEQSRGWAIGYATLIGLIFLCAVQLWRGQKSAETNAQAAGRGQNSGEGGSRGNTGAGQSDVTISWKRRLRWVALSAVPSSLLLGVTAHLSTDIAAVPLLWVIPLALYLLSFVLVFSRRQILTHPWMLRVQIIVVPAVAAIFYVGGMQSSQVALMALLHLLAFFITAMVCHGELAKDRPASEQLTEFYLWMSLGGVAGGLLNALIAPLLFPGVWEYPLMIVAACALRPRPTTPITPTGAKLDLGLLTVLGIVMAVAFYSVHHRGFDPLWVKAELVGLAALAAALLFRRPERFAAGVTATLAVSFLCSNETSPLYRTRSFFGVLRVEREDRLDTEGDDNYSANRLLHGSTLHGMQSLDPEEALDPWTYYHRTGPVGDVFDELRAWPAFRKAGKIGVVGLGTGSIAAYGLKGQEMTFFEIDPAVVDIARDRGYFTYLRDCEAKVRIVLGDARLSLENEPDGAFDVLLVDAFSSDAIPLHLLTREAIALYFRKLAPEGLLAVHISNRHLDLKPVLANLAEDADPPLEARVANDDDESDKGKSSSTWMVLARNEAALGDLESQHGNRNHWKAVEGRPELRLWTDDYSNILSVLDRDFNFRWLKWE